MSSLALLISLLVAISLPGLGLALVIALARRYLRCAGGQVADAVAQPPRAVAPDDTHGRGRVTAGTGPLVMFSACAGRVR